MFERYYLSEELEFVIQFIQEFFIFTCAQADAGVCFYPKPYKIFNALDHKSFYRIDQFLAVVIVIIFFFKNRLIEN